MPNVVFVAVGGLLGSVARYLISGWVQERVTNGGLPWGTLSVNATGCLLIGILGGLAESRGFFGPESRAFLFIGVLGGFTTFSTFGYETFALLRDGQAVQALGNIALQLGVGLAAVWLGYAVVKA
ncbi:MAG: fluoride efflux transporter CrcB [Dehalococcoidia bacterium]|nr:fluoride efflux transporter CrcB [Dehalococcoidia bacterium]